MRGAFEKEPKSPDAYLALSELYAYTADPYIGLSAQLATQSLLTGLLYVDLDLRPQRESATDTERSSTDG